jgi:hypothetical protein
MHSASSDSFLFRYRFLRSQHSFQQKPKTLIIQNPRLKRRMIEDLWLCLNPGIIQSFNWSSPNDVKKACTNGSGRLRWDSDFYSARGGCNWSGEDFLAHVYLRVTDYSTFVGIKDYGFRYFDLVSSFSVIWGIIIIIICILIKKILLRGFYFLGRRNESSESQ